MTKLFQSNDPTLRRMCYLTIKEMSCIAEDVIIVTSSLTKDMTGKEDNYRGPAVRALCQITDSTMLQAIERYMKQAIVDRVASVSSSALVSSLHLLKCSFDVVKRWVNEAQEAASSDNIMVQMCKSEGRLACGSCLPTVLQLFCSSPKAALRYAAVRTLNKVAMKHPSAVTACNLDLENLVTDSNRSIATLAITTLLKTGSESSIDRLMKQISSFMSEISDEFKVVVVQAISALCQKYPRKHAVLMNFLFTMLREEGGFEYKRAIVDCIISIIEENSESKETGLSHLCEFIEDCEFTVLATRILHLLGQEGPKTNNPSKYIRFIYNRVVLEHEEVRAVFPGYRIRGLSADSLKTPAASPRPLIQCVMDDDNEVRDRATFYLNVLEQKQKALNAGYILNGEPLAFFSVPCPGTPSRDRGSSRQDVPGCTLACTFSCVMKFTIKDRDPSTGETDDEGYEDEYVLEDVEVTVADHIQKVMKLNFEAAWEGVGDEFEKEETFTLSTIKTLEEAVGNIVKFLGMHPCERSDRVPDNKNTHTLLLAVCLEVEMLSERGPWLSEQLAAVPEFRGLGPLFKSSPEPVALTESETEYVIRCTKHTFPEHMVFQFDCTNTLNDQTLENVTVQMEPTEAYEVLCYVPARSLPYNQPGTCYTLVALPKEDPTAGESSPRRCPGVFRGGHDILVRSRLLLLDTVTLQVTARSSEELPVDIILASVG
ncbi:PREDICTED: coatomer subunit gamma-1-like [Propithecus coquereli]|uniref:coatomer subunit gamma-1-like n=1 Tax=Propithecus coquereli TaxID=379532 RepID=UPI00063FBFFC|nr:PREDICTED: coatomer subunit gamma-1-like [Propithecus coquereli]